MLPSNKRPSYNQKERRTPPSMKRSPSNERPLREGFSLEKW